MKEIHLDSVQQVNEIYGFETLHPLVSVVRHDQPRMPEESLIHYGLYALFLKENKGCKLSYGRTPYDFDEMTVTSFAPGQTIHVQPMPGVTAPHWGGASANTSFSPMQATRHSTCQPVK